MDNIPASFIIKVARIVTNVYSRRAAEAKNNAAAARPAGTRAAGVGGSSGTMLKLYTDDVGRGFKV